MATTSQQSKVSELVYDQFLSTEDSNHVTCKQPNCSARLVKKTSTLKRHLQRNHSALYESLLNEAAPTSERQMTLDNFVVKKGAILDLCANVAIEGRPFTMFDSPSLKRILEFAVLGAKEPKQSFSGARVRQAVVQRAKTLRDVIKTQLRNQAISISADFASLHGNQFLAVMAQFERQGKIQVVNLACRQVRDSHTAANIKKWFKEVLAEYDIKETSVLAVTCDSAANIQKAAKLFLEDLKDNQFAVGYQDFEESSDAENDCFGFELEASEEVHDDGETEPQSEITGSLAQQMMPTSFRVACVVHQLQLAINKWCEDQTIRNILATSRALAARLRTQNVLRVLQNEGFPNAILDQDTRWSSKFRMMQRLLELKEFCMNHSRTELKDVRQPEIFWDNLEKTAKILAPLADLTTKLQNEQLTIPKFNEFWIEARLELDSFIEPNKSYPLPRLIELLNERRQIIDANPLVIAGIYLDPRTRKSLTNSQQNTSKQLISAVFNRLHAGSISVVESESTSQAEPR
jgi:hypothetical protein